MPGPAVNMPSNLAAAKAAAPGGGFGGGAPGGYDPIASGTGYYQSVLDNNGTLIPGSGGGFISAAPQRAAAQAGYGQALANNNQVYDQAVGLVQARDPGIQAGYDAGTAAVQADARQRAITNAATQSNQAQQFANAASALGLSGVGLPTQSRAATIYAGDQAKLDQNANTWTGFNAGAAQRAVAGNNNIANALLSQKGTQGNALAALLQRSLATMVDRSSRGSSAKLVGAPSISNKLAAARGLVGAGYTGSAQSLSAAKAKNAQTNAQARNTISAAKAKAGGANFTIAGGLTG